MLIMRQNKPIKKIGIITHYFNSLNYGGNLQAYALPVFLNNNGFEAEQICFQLFMMGKKDSKIVAKTKKYIKNVLKFLLFNKKYIKTLKLNKQKKNKFKNFNSTIIKNNKNVYDDDTIHKIKDKYDYFISGSDLVWNPDNFMPSFYLEFVDNNNKKISYAASVGRTCIDSKYKERIINDINAFKAISVREKTAKYLLSKYINKDIVTTVDSTLLLNKSDWDSIKAKECKYTNYVLCYFLGNNSKERELALAFARKKELKVICILNEIDKREYIDINYGDIRLIPSPEEFITLIENAEYIFTDSFHACIFSYIYQKQFFVFNRDINKTSISRIYDLLDLLNMNNRLCEDEKISLEYLLNIENHQYKRNEKLENAIQKSKEFLINSLNE